jgi:hypothetical protein
MRLTRIVLTALAVAASVPPVCVAQFTPQWHVGDWWVVKVWESDLPGNRPLERFDILGMDKVGGTGCYVLQAKMGDTTPSRDGERDVYYVRASDYLVIRKVEYLCQAGEPMRPRVFDCPEGMFGPTPFHPRLPLFPLDSAARRDSTFRDYRTALSGASLRWFSGIADSALLRRYFSEPSTSGARLVQPLGGTMFSVLSEMGVRRDSVTVPSVYSLQLWSRDYPWRLYEENGQCAPDGTRHPRSRSWLVACGGAERKQ